MSVLSTHHMQCHNTSINIENKIHDRPFQMQVITTTCIIGTHMSLKLISEHSKSIYEFRVTNKINRSNKSKTDGWGRVQQLSQREQC